MHDAWCMIHDAWCMMHDAWRLCMMRSESSNYKIGRLNKDCLFWNVCWDRQTHQPRYQLQPIKSETRVCHWSALTCSYMHLLWTEHFQCFESWTLLRKVTLIIHHWKFISKLIEFYNNKEIFVLGSCNLA